MDHFETTICELLRQKFLTVQNNWGFLLNSVAEGV